MRRLPSAHARICLFLLRQLVVLLFFSLLRQLRQLRLLLLLLLVLLQLMPLLLFLPLRLIPTLLMVPLVMQRLRLLLQLRAEPPWPCLCLNRNHRLLTRSPRLWLRLSTIATHHRPRSRVVGPPAPPLLCWRPRLLPPLAALARRCPGGQPPGCSQCRG